MSIQPESLSLFTCVAESENKINNRSKSVCSSTRHLVETYQCFPDIYEKGRFLIFSMQLDKFELWRVINFYIRRAVTSDFSLSVQSYGLIAQLFNWCILQKMYTLCESSSICLNSSVLSWSSLLSGSHVLMLRYPSFFISGGT